MGFTQRQAGGKFTADEADAFIDQLNEEAEGSATPPAAASAAKLTAADRALRDIPNAHVGRRTPATRLDRRRAVSEL